MLTLIGIAVSMYYIAHYGFFSFVMRMTFTPDI